MESKENSTPKPKDQKVTCKSCQQGFSWSAKEQLYYQKKGFKKKPQKCASCREKANKLRDENMFYVHCGICDKNARMISPPPKDRVALCESCYNKLADAARKDNTPLP